jgi:hypothetical protein
MQTNNKNTERKNHLRYARQTSIPDNSNPPTTKDNKEDLIDGPVCVAPDLYSVLLPCITPSAFKQYMTLFASAEEDERQTAVQGSGSS